MNADLHRLVIENLHLDPSALNPASGLEEAGLDSLAIAELGMLLADLGVPIPDEQWSGVTTLADLDAVVDAVVGERLADGPTR